MRSERVRAGLDSNTLTVRAIGPKITFLVGDAEVLSFEDSTLREGAVDLAQRRERGVRQRESDRHGSIVSLDAIDGGAGMTHTACP